MRYQKVLWRHELAGEPVVPYGEIDAGFEFRKVEVYRDGRVDYADGSASERIQPNPLRLRNRILRVACVFSGCQAGRGASGRIPPGKWAANDNVFSFADKAAKP